MPVRPYRGPAPQTRPPKQGRSTPETLCTVLGITRRRSRSPGGGGARLSQLGGPKTAVLCLSRAHADPEPWKIRWARHVLPYSFECRLMTSSRVKNSRKSGNETMSRKFSNPCRRLMVSRGGLLAGVVVLSVNTTRSIRQISRLPTHARPPAATHRRHRLGSFATSFRLPDLRVFFTTRRVLKTDSTIGTKRGRAPILFQPVNRLVRIMHHAGAFFAPQLAEGALHRSRPD